MCNLRDALFIWLFTMPVMVAVGGGGGGGVMNGRGITSSD